MKFFSTPAMQSDSHSKHTQEMHAQSANINVTRTTQHI